MDKRLQKIGVGPESDLLAVASTEDCLLIFFVLSEIDPEPIDEAEIVPKPFLVPAPVAAPNRATFNAVFDGLLDLY